MSTNGVQRYDYETSDFSDSNIKIFRGLYILFMGPYENHEQARIEAQKHQSLLPEFKKYKSAADLFLENLAESAYDSFFKSLKLSLELSEHNEAIQRIDHELDDIHRERKQLVNGYANELSRDLGNRGNSSTSGKRERKKSTCTIV